MIWKFAPLLPSKNSIVNGYFSLIVTVFSIILYLFFFVEAIVISFSAARSKYLSLQAIMI